MLVVIIYVINQKARNSLYCTEHKNEKKLDLCKWGKSSCGKLVTGTYCEDHAKIIKNICQFLDIETKEDCWNDKCYNSDYCSKNSKINNGCPYIIIRGSRKGTFCGAMKHQGLNYCKLHHVRLIENNNNVDIGPSNDSKKSAIDDMVSVDKCTKEKCNDIIMSNNGKHGGELSVEQYGKFYIYNGEITSNN